MKKELRVTSREILKWTKDHSNPSEPHQELVPWLNLLRPVSARNHVLLYMYPEDEHLHP